MPNSEYWQKRAQQVIQAELKEDAAISKEVERLILMMYAEIEREIMAFYAKYAAKEGVPIAEAKKKIDATDITLFKERVKEYVRNKDFSEKANEELRQYNTKMYVNREQLLKAQLAAIATYYAAQSEQMLYGYMESSIYRQIEQQAGILGETVTIKPTAVKAIINSAFGKVTWSERLWEDMTVVQKEVEKMASHVLLRGRHPNEYVADLRKKTGAATSSIKRLLITEAARTQSEAQKLFYEETLGEDGKYQFVAKMDEKTSEQCSTLDGKIFKVKDMVIGVNAPPLHPHCRSTTAPYLGDWREKYFKERKGKYGGGGVKLG